MNNTQNNKIEKKLLIVFIAILLVIITPIISHSLTHIDLETTPTYHFRTSTGNSDYTDITIDNENKKIIVEGKTLLNKNCYAILIQNYNIDLNGNEPTTVSPGHLCFRWSDGLSSDKSFEKGIPFEDIDKEDNSNSFNKLYLSVHILNDNSAIRSNAVIQGLEIVFDNNGDLSIPSYNKCADRNQEVMIKSNISHISPDAFLDKTLSTENSYANGNYELTNSTQVNSIKSLSDSLTKESNDDYSKLLDIYTWITEHTYYDYDANYNSSAEVNPHKLYKQFLENNKMWTYCNGYASMFTALARAQNIPTRIVSGTAISPPYDIWNDEDFNRVDHSWVESYVEGKWIAIDPTRGTNNMYKSKKFDYTGTTRYSFFDMTEENLASTHYYIEYAKGNYKMEYLLDDNDVLKLREYLSSKNSYGNINGKLINSNYSPDNKATWGYGGNYNASINPLGQIKRIEWSGSGIDEKEKLGRSLDLSGASGLEYFSMSSQYVSSLNFDKCKLLKSVYCTWNKITSLDLSDSQALISLTCTNNPTTSIKYKNHLGKVVTLSAGTGGYIEGTYKGDLLTIASKSLPGYYPLGVYNSSGNRITSKTSYKFKPNFTNYSVKFGLTTSGYPGYSLRNGMNSGSIRQNCNKSIETRLKTLGYFQLTPNDYYTESTAAAVKAFQYNNGVSATGTVDQTTWNKLFTTKAKSIYKASYYKQMNLGYSGSKAYLLETRLKQLGYFDHVQDTYYGTATRDGVKAFQSANNVSVTGTVNRTTWNKAFSTNTKRIYNASYKNQQQLGASSNETLLIEYRLKQLAYFNSTPNSYFGTTTRDAVKAFQCGNNLSPSGKVNEITWNKMFASSANLIYNTSYAGLLELGSSNDKTMLVEFRLIQLGYFNYLPNSYYGTGTRDGIKAFQYNNGISSTGIVNKTTWDKLFTTTAKQIYKASYYKMLSVGYSGTKAYLLEFRLKQLGYLTATPDKYFGTATRDAVNAFKANYGYSYNGKVNSTVWNNVFSANAKSIYSSGYTYLKNGNYSSKNVIVEQRLSNLGYFNHTPDRYFKISTKNSVKTYQSKHGLSKTGTINSATWKKLFSK